MLVIGLCALCNQWLLVRVMQREIVVEAAEILRLHREMSMNLLPKTANVLVLMTQ